MMYTPARAPRISASWPKSIPTPGVRCIDDAISANWVWPAALAAATTWSWVMPAGRLLLIAPSKIRLIALAMIFGPMTAKKTLTTARRTTTAIFGRSGPR